jgi:pimeloyl-ACP methyl ester carboxylesterase
MPISKPHTGKKYIFPLNMNKLRGRMLIVPKLRANSKTEFLVIYGQKSTLEKWLSLALELSKYGNVTMPDLPGFGGMQSFYKINEKPTIDNYADYLAAFIKLRYRRKKIVIIGLSFGFVVVTRMFQKYPDMTSRVNFVINVSGFCHKDDIRLSKWKKSRITSMSKLFTYYSASSIHGTFMEDELIHKLVHTTPKGISSQLDKNTKNKILKFELAVQKKNDTRTHMYVTNQILKLDTYPQSIDLPVWSLVGQYDEYLYPDSVKSHTENIYHKYHEIQFKKTSHKGFAGPIQADYITSLIPYKLKVLLNKGNK